MNSFANILIGWYTENKRDLPWRQTKDPYKIWLSEIILQQTQISMGLHYYNRILKRYPDVESLARADKNEFLKLWQGLGYYRRAENMLQAADYVVKHCHGKMPESYYLLLKIKGVGEYTAAAIASFAFNLPVPVIDGNVNRVISRLFDVSALFGSKAFDVEIKAGINAVFDDKHPATFNQAIMEFGALQCKKIPLCEDCPLKEKCLAFDNNVQKIRPVKHKSKSKIPRHFYYAIIMEEGKIALTRRDNADIWRSLYEFPLVELPSNASDKEILDAVNHKYGLGLLSLLPLSSYPAHILSHQEIYAHVFLASGKIGSEINKIKVSELYTYPVHRLMDKIIKSQSVKSVIFHDS
ncbi:MAG: A/G-specific adenine glycosylase [Bacteroidota bacterium]|nr:A/G-specific adenine glycosylase [Bacteroidota bacterium]